MDPAVTASAASKDRLAEADSAKERRAVDTAPLSPLGKRQRAEITMANSQAESSPLADQAYAGVNGPVSVPVQGEGATQASEARGAPDELVMDDDASKDVEAMLGDFGESAASIEANATAVNGASARKDPEDGVKSQAQMDGDLPKQPEVEAAQGGATSTEGAHAAPTDDPATPEYSEFTQDQRESAPAAAEDQAIANYELVPTPPNPAPVSAVSPQLTDGLSALVEPSNGVSMALANNKQVVECGVRTFVVLTGRNVQDNVVVRVSSEEARVRVEYEPIIRLKKYHASLGVTVVGPPCKFTLSAESHGVFSVSLDLELTNGPPAALRLNGKSKDVIQVPGPKKPLVVTLCDLHGNIARGGATVSVQTRGGPLYFRDEGTTGMLSKPILNLSLPFSSQLVVSQYNIECTTAGGGTIIFSVQDVARKAPTGASIEVAVLEVLVSKPSAVISGSALSAVVAAMPQQAMGPVVVPVSARQLPAGPNAMPSRKRTFLDAVETKTQQPNTSVAGKPLNNAASLSTLVSALSVPPSSVDSVPAKAAAQPNVLRIDLPFRKVFTVAAQFNRSSPITQKSNPSPDFLPSQASLSVTSSAPSLHSTPFQKLDQPSQKTFINVSSLPCNQMINIECTLPNNAANGLPAHLTFHCAPAPLSYSSRVFASRVVFEGATTPLKAGLHHVTLTVPLSNITLSQTIAVDASLPVGLGYDSGRLVSFVTNSPRDLRLRCLIPGVLWLFPHDKYGNLCDVPGSFLPSVQITDVANKIADLQWPPPSRVIPLLTLRIQLEGQFAQSLRQGSFLPLTNLAIGVGIGQTGRYNLKFQATINGILVESVPHSFYLLNVTKFPVKYSIPASPPMLPLSSIEGAWVRHYSSLVATLDSANVGMTLRDPRELGELVHSLHNLIKKQVSSRKPSVLGNDLPPALSTHSGFIAFLGDMFYVEDESVNHVLSAYVRLPRP